MHACNNEALQPQTESGDFSQQLLGAIMTHNVKNFGGLS
uniref:Uncharacterized protein n=1 Tax=Anguilla anguilla TaxID=7936 RepID=A0A0E9T9H3_ANGAN